jgi:hypothetical protein
VRRIRTGFLLVVPLALAGCGGEEFHRHRVQGTVTFDGKPVESGSIFFEPTESVGDLAPTLYLKVQNGDFDTGEDGPIAGKYTIVVGGFDESKQRPGDDGGTYTPPLFETYRFDVHIPPPNNTLDVEVPASQALASG